MKRGLKMRAPEVSGIRHDQAGQQSVEATPFNLHGGGEYINESKEKEK